MAGRSEFDDPKVPAIDSSDNETSSDVIGNKSDTGAGTSIRAGLVAVKEGVTEAVPEPPVASSIQDILHKDGSFTFDKGTDSLEAISDNNFKTLVRTSTILTSASTICFNVTGSVIVKIFGICKTGVTTDGAVPTIELGVSGNTAILIAQIADARDLAINEIWTDATPDSTVQDISSLPEFVISNGQDIILTVGNSANVTAGDVELYCIWKPLSDGASISVA
jgi:hypothetical protein